MTESGEQEILQLLVSINQQLEQQSERLEQQSERLEQQNERLQEQGARLDQQGERLEQQNERLEQQNERLGQQSQSLDKLERQQELSNTIVQTYQKASQQVVNLAFGLIATAAGTIILQAVLAQRPDS